MATVLLLPGTEPADELATVLGEAGPPVIRVHPIAGPEGSLPARVCAAIALLAPDPPLIIAAEGQGALVLPAVALAQRSAHRRVTEYLLVEPELPAVTDSWPDAPVTVVSDADGWVAAQARLRGWELLSRDDLRNWRPAL